jgi:plastocyanin
MVLKAVIIVLSIVGIVLTSVIVGGAIIVGQVLENDPNIRNEIRQWLGEGASEQDSQERSSSASSLPIAEEGRVVSIIGNSGSNSYNPNPIEIEVGDTVTWINNDSSPHTVTTSSSKSNFDSDVLRRGETFSFTFDREGEYPYFCTLHPSMVGTVVVLPPEGG